MRTSINQMLPLMGQLGIDYLSESGCYTTIKAGDLESILERAPVVYGMYSHGQYTTFSEQPGGAAAGHINNPHQQGKTHKARLLLIEPLVCAHTTLRHTLGDPNMAMCDVCGKKVRAQWVEA